MKIEKLNENKIRITLNLEDLSERDIDFHSFMSNSIESQSIFLDMLDKADREVGFNTDDCRIMIEALALKNGNFVLTITKFEHTTDENTKTKAQNQKKKALHIKRKAPIWDSRKVIYSFESFDVFCNFCSFLLKCPHTLNLSKFAEESVLYEYNSNFYLILTNICLDSELSKFICNSITEFAHFVENSELFEKRITEYGRPIMPSQAIITCIEHFCVKK